MTVEHLYTSLGDDCTNIDSIAVTDSHTSATATAVITCEQTDLHVGSSVSIILGYQSANQKVFEGYVKSVENKEEPKGVTITAANAMIRAVDYFIAAANPNNALTFDHVKAEDLVGQLMIKAGLTNYTADDSHFTFGINNSFEVNLTSVYDYSKFIADIIAFIVYADENGLVHFEYRPPFIDTGDVATATLDDSNIITIDYNQSDKDLRNRIVVYGAGNVHATAQEASPYLPDGFYKSMVVAAPTVIDTQSMAQRSADYNLPLVNRLTKQAQVTVIGNPALKVRGIVTVNKADIGMTGDWYIYSLQHDFSKSGFLTTLNLRQ